MNHRNEYDKYNHQSTSAEWKSVREQDEEIPVIEAQEGSANTGAQTKSSTWYLFIWLNLRKSMTLRVSTPGLSASNPSKSLGSRSVQVCVTDNM